MEDDISKFDFQNYQKKSIFLVIGIGGGGTNAVNYMFQNSIKDVDYLILNTDQQSLKNSPVKK